MGGYAIPRKRRKHQAILKSSSLFSKAIDREDYKIAIAIVFWTALHVGGVEGIMNALNNGNSFYKRKYKRKYV